MTPSTASAWATSRWTQFSVTAIPPGSTVVCYADDTLVLSGVTDWGEATALANVTVECVVRSIRALGLRVAPNKTEALFLHARSVKPPPQAHIMVADTGVEMGPMLKSLGLTLDGTWGFVEHFERLSPKMGRMAGALACLLPNFGGPRTAVCQHGPLHGPIRGPGVGG
ncbi:uncharacterized protein LOC116846721 [Odontomachus brunneus]|uniref:uncharacterized protein LOC116846721 n=1 Tax=Odontomachus brunneus TaxID=486640 RepID=UPI0013F195C2|nr:uncharacterized protein LOC116846721 [Odontomachus brunneus]